MTATGVLRRRKLAPDPDPTLGPHGAVTSGIAGESFVLENPSWTIEE